MTDFARLFWYGWVETGLNGWNGRAKVKSCGHPRIKLKKCFVIGRPKSLLRIAAKKLILKTSSNTYIVFFVQSEIVLVLLRSFFYSFFYSTKNCKFFPCLLLISAFFHDHHIIIHHMDYDSRVCFILNNENS